MTVLRAVWTNKLIVGALGLQNELEAREWFRINPHMHDAFDELNHQLQAKINEIQNVAYRGLIQARSGEQGIRNVAFPEDFNLVKRVKSEPIEDTEMGYVKQEETF